MTDLSRLVKEIAQGLQPQFDKPFVFFGHSLGALIAFELARETRRQFGLLPLHLFASARVAPQTNRPRRPIHGLPESEFIEEIRRLNGTPKEVFDVPELLELILPVLRADFALNETYTYSSEPPLACPITTFGGLNDDSTTPDGLAAWRGQTSSTFTLRMLPGDHFFINSSKALLLRMLHGELEDAM
jgi:medium-chain acyl-[acyl-carrier-protein] hydrolase